MNINFVISPYPASSNQWRVSVFEANNPTAEVDFQLINAPHTSPQAVSFTGLDEVVHLVKITDVPSGTVLIDFMHNPVETSYIVEMPLFHVVGDGQPNTPLAGTNTYRNSSLKDKEYDVERRPLGTLHDGVEITKVASDPNYGFDLALPGDQWGAGDSIVIKIRPKDIKTIVNESVAGKWFEGSVTISSNTPYNTTHLKKLLELRGSGTELVYTLPSSANAPIGYIFPFQTYGSAWTSHKIQSPETNIEQGGTIGNSLTMGQNSTLFLYFNGTLWQVVARSSGASALTVSDNPDLDDSNVLASTKATKTLADRDYIIARGKTNIGDVPAGDPIYEQTFANPGNADYMVFGSILSNSTNKIRDNTITFSWWKDSVTPNTKFRFSLQELISETQNLEFCWIVVKI